jgi:ABC-type nickel/cobalt efflux system permease component RcnA
MMTLISILFLGFFLGMRHATDADHVVAVTTIVSRERTIQNAAFIGAVWGVGHTMTLVLVGGTIVLFQVVVPARLGLSLEFSVALMLIFLGVLNFKSFARSLRQNVDAGQERVGGVCHMHSHSHGDLVHSHPHGHDPESHGHTTGDQPPAGLNLKVGRLGFYQTLRPLIVGIVHGLAGSAAVALLVLPLIQKPVWAIAYLLVFGVGTIGGMMLITAAIALPFKYTARRSAVFHRRLGFAAGFLSVGFGLFLVYQIGFVDGLFIK